MLPPFTMNLDEIFYLALCIMNVFAACLVAYTQLRFYWIFHSYSFGWTWVKLGLGLMGIYWAVLYIIVILETLGIMPAADPVGFGRIFVRPALTVTLGLIAAGGLMRWKLP